MPGGGTNVELALHCLHAAQGNILDALDMLLVKGPQRTQSHPLAHYHYNGTDFWTPSEKRLFKKGFCAYKKDFYLIQNMIQTKNVSQCIEYYYTWKKIIKFDQSKYQTTDKKVKTDQSDAEATRPKITQSAESSSDQQHEQRRKLMLKQQKQEKQSGLATQKEAAAKPEGTSIPGRFACKECERVFEKIKSRNAHMKRHRQQEHAGRPARKWPKKYIQLDPKECKMTRTPPLASSSPASLQLPSCSSS